MFQALANDELRRVLECARSHSERDWLMILVAYNHGLRRSEVVAIMRDDIADGFLTVQRKKGSKRTIQELVSNPDPLFSERESLIAFAGKANFSKPIFDISDTQFYRIFRRHSESAGVPKHKRHPHVLKHSCGRQMQATTKDITLTKEWLGHQSISSTGIYTEAQEDEVAAGARKAFGV